MNTIKSTSLLLVFFMLKWKKESKNIKTINKENLLITIQK